MTRFERSGAMIVRDVLDTERISEVRQAFPPVPSRRPGSRGHRLTPAFDALIRVDGPLGRLATTMMGFSMEPVRVLLFDKTPAMNWGVPWHQDRTIAVKARHDVEGFASWNVKEGVVHVEPPAELLSAMLTLRLFVDDCDESNGPLRIALGSHALGRVPAAQAAGLAQQFPIIEATGRAGDVLVMRLLALHASEPARVPQHRRVLHVDYAGFSLPAPLEWALPASRERQGLNRLSHDPASD